MATIELMGRVLYTVPEEDALILVDFARKTAYLSGLRARSPRAREIMETLLLLISMDAGDVTDSLTRERAAEDFVARTYPRAHAERELLTPTNVWRKNSSPKPWRLCA